MLKETITIATGQLNLEPFGYQADALATWLCCLTCTRMHTHTHTHNHVHCYGDVSICSTLFTATEILSHMISTFTEVNDKVLQPLLSEAVGADDLLPMAIYVTVKARCVLYRIL